VTIPALASACRLRALLALEARLQWRYGVVALAVALAAGWSGLLLALPDPAARAVAPWLLMLETAVLGTTLAGALVQLERGQGMLAARSVSPARAGERLAARVGLLTALVLATAVPVALAGRPTGLPLVLVGVGLTALLTMLLAVVVAAGCQSALGFMIALPLGLLPLLAPAVAQGAGWSHPALFLAPTTGAMELVQAGYRGAGAVPVGPAAGWLAWLGAGCAVAGWVAARRLCRAGRAGGDPAPAGAHPRTGRARRPGGPVRSFLRTDLANLRRDRLLRLVAVSPLLLGVAARTGYPPLRDWLTREYELDLDPYRPVLLAVVVLLHVPVTFGMIGALLVLDDLADRALVAVRVSPLTLPRYLGYRTGLVTVAALAGLAVAVPLSGLAPLAAWPRLVPAGLLAGLVTPVVMLGTLAVARDKVAGVAVLKLLGPPIYAPLAGWWLAGPAGWPLAVLPTWWVLRALWSGWPYPVAGVVVLAGVVALLARRTLGQLAAAARPGSP
jgi:fluoroquinolone transport system permease protein